MFYLEFVWAHLKFKAYEKKYVCVMMRMNHLNEFLHASNKYLLNAHYLADTMLGANFTVMMGKLPSVK